MSEARVQHGSDAAIRLEMKAMPVPRTTDLMPDLRQIFTPSCHIPGRRLKVPFRGGCSSPTAAVNCNRREPRSRWSRPRGISSSFWLPFAEKHPIHFSLLLYAFPAPLISSVLPHPQQHQTAPSTINCIPDTPHRAPLHYLPPPNPPP